MGCLQNVLTYCSRPAWRLQRRDRRQQRPAPLLPTQHQGINLGTTSSKKRHAKAALPEETGGDTPTKALTSNKAKKAKRTTKPFVDTESEDEFVPDGDEAEEESE